MTLPTEYRFYRAFYRNNFRLTCQSCYFYVQRTQLIICIAPAWSCSFSTGQFSLLFMRQSLSEAGHRYTNIIVASLSSWQFYAHSFTAESCRRLFLVPAVFRGSFYNMAILRGIERKRSVYGYGFTNDNWFTVGCNLSPYRYWSTTSHISLISLERTPFPARIRPWGLRCFVHLFLRPQ
jgi:hypothetical protein